MKHGLLIRIGLLALLVAMTWMHGYTVGKGKPQLAAAQAQNQATTRSIEAAEGTRTRREDKRTERRSEASKQDKEVSRALEDNPDWADAPVPDSVWDSIFGARAGDPGRAD